MRFLAAILFFLMPCLANTMHPVRLSLVNMDLDLEKKELRYSVRLYHHDFQAMVNSMFGQAIELEGEVSSNQVSIMKGYLDESLVLKDEKGLALMPVLGGWQVEGLYLWFYFELQLNDIPERLIVHNKLMLEAFPDQVNLLVFASSRQEEGYMFNSKLQEDAIPIQN